MAEKSALRLIPGRDALLEHENRVYEAKEYVEYNGYVYKANSETSATFVPSEWSLIGDLRDVRVPNIASRNALTGSTPTSGTTGINIPILDNTNVLVLDASGDPQVGTNVFARYNYNKTTGEFLLLQISTGSTASNVSDYTELTNKPQIISGITATAGAGLTGGGIFSGSIPPNRASFTFSHADTSAQTNLTPTGRTYVQQLKFDGFGHVTGATTSAWTHPDTSTQASVNNTGFTFIQNVQLDDAGHVASLSSAAWTHPDTSTQGDVNNTGNTVIQSIQLDGAGHIIGISSATVSGSGGSGVAFSINGNSGGVRSMPNNGVLMISGASNIQSVTSSVGDNRVVKLNFTPAGSNGQIQINSGGVLSVGAGFTYLSNKLTSPSLALSSALTLSTNTASTTQILTRNTTSGDIERITVSSISALPTNAIQFRKSDGSFGGDVNFLFDSSVDAVTLGTRRVGHVSGSNSFSIGTNNIVSGSTSMGIGSLLTVGENSFAVGTSSQAYASSVAISSSYASSGSIAAGNGGTTASGAASSAFGSSARSAGLASMAMGSASYATGNGSFAGGYGYGFTSAYNVNPISFGIRVVYAAGESSFNFSKNTISQTVGHGALAAQSAILGGLNHNIESGNVRSAIIGGQLIKLTGTTYIDTVAVPSLALFTTPTSAGAEDELLTWNSSNKKVGKTANVTYSNVAYVSKNGNNTTGTVGKAARPYLTIQAAVNALALGALTSTNRGIVYVMQGHYSETVTLANYVDIDFNNAGVTTLYDNGVAVEVNVFGNGRIGLLNIGAASTINVTCQQIFNSGSALSISSHVASGTAKINVKAHLIGNMQIYGCDLVATSNRIEGSLNIYGSLYTSAIVNANLWGGNGVYNAALSVALIYINNTHANTYANINTVRIENQLTTSSGLLYHTNGFIGRAIFTTQEGISFGSTGIMAPSNLTGNVTIGGIFRMVGGTNQHVMTIAAIAVGSIFKILGGSQFISTGTGLSIDTSGAINVVALGQIFGRTAVDAGVTIQLGTFTVDSTYIV